MKSEIQSLAKILDTDDKTLYQIIEKPSSFYRSFPIKRTRKRPRWINAPDPTLKLIQRNILNNTTITILDFSSRRAAQHTPQLLQNP